MMRRPDWRSRLSAYVGAARQRPYALGSQDCCLFVSGAVEAMTGSDFAGAQRGGYRTTRQALALMRETGFADLAAVAAHLFEEISPVSAQIGDVMAIPTGDAFGYALGILNGERVLVVTPHGIDTRDRSEATRAFRV